MDELLQKAVPAAIAAGFIVLVIGAIRFIGRRIDRAGMKRTEELERQAEARRRSSMTGDQP